MKKMCVLFLSVFTLPAIASGINSSATSAPCTNNTLETYSGNTNLAADWQPNTINLRWYNNNTLMDVQSSANTCVYDGTLTVPQTAPTRTGYTFDGWQVRPEIDFATIPTNVQGTNLWAICRYNNTKFCWYGYGTTTETLSVVDCNSDITYNELQPYEWKIHFEHGDLYGMATCSTTSGTSSQPGNPTIANGTGQYCWCKATGYKATNASVISGSSSRLPWIHSVNYGDVVSCARGCMANCAFIIIGGAGFRRALFTPAQ